MSSKKSIEERLEDMEKEIAAVKVAWTVFKWIGRVILAVIGIFAALHAAK